MKKVLAILISAFMLMAVMPMSFAQNTEMTKAQEKTNSEFALSNAANRYGSSLVFNGDWRVESGVPRSYGTCDVLAAFADDGHSAVTARALITEETTLRFDYYLRTKYDQCSFIFSYSCNDDSYVNALDLYDTDTTGWVTYELPITTAGSYEFRWEFLPAYDCQEGSGHYVGIDDVYLSSAKDLGITYVGNSVNVEMQDFECDAVAEVISGYVPEGCKISLNGYTGFTLFCLYGKANFPGTYEFTVAYFDENAGYLIDTVSYVYTVMPAASNNFKTLDNGFVSQKYSTTIEYFTGEVYEDAEIIAGRIPRGMTEDFGWGTDSVDSAYYFSGTPLEKGVFRFTVRYTEERGYTYTCAYEFTVTAPTDYALYSDFEDGLSGWSAYDLDGDGKNWKVSMLPAYEGNGCIKSESYINYEGALTPDNLLVSPQFTVGNGSVLSWYDCGQDPDYCAEPYSVYIGTGSNMNNYTKLGDYKATKEWVNHTIDISSYAGKTLSVAFRHYNATDLFALKLDLITVTEDSTPVQTIDRIDISNADITPIAGDLAGDHLAYTLPSDANYTCVDHIWFDDTNSLRFENDEQFVSGNMYSTGWIIKAASGYVFDENTAVTINGSDAVVDMYNTAISTDNNTIFYVWTKSVQAEEAPEDIVISNITINGADITPIAGDYAGYNLEYTLPSGANYTCTDHYWYDDTNGHGIADDEQFISGNMYSTAWRIKAASGYVFDENTTVTINGSDAVVDMSCTSVDEYDNTVFYVWTKSVQAVEPSSQHTVTFVDGVTGETISTVTVEHGKDAELPTAPEHEGYIFKGWDSDGKNIVADTTITAQYLLLGDTNFDGAVNTGDAVMILRSCVGLVELSDDQKLAADMSGDGKINTGDAVAVLRFYVGLKEA